MSNDRTNDLKLANKITNNEIEKIVQTRMQILGITDTYSTYSIFFNPFKKFTFFKYKLFQKVLRMSQTNFLM